MADETVSQCSDASYEAQEARRLECLKLEKDALGYGDYDNSLRHQIAQILCAGQYVRQSEGGSCTAEHALLRYAAAVTKAIGIALNEVRSGEEAHDTLFCDHEATIALTGLSALLEAAPKLINAIDSAGLDLRSEGDTCAKATGEEAAS